MNFTFYLSPNTFPYYMLFLSQFIFLELKYSLLKWYIVNLSFTIRKKNGQFFISILNYFS